MISQTDLTAYLSAFFNSDEISDDCPNGLQVEGRKHIAKIITGVTASQALLDQALAKNADAILVHHGYFWKREAMPITGIKYLRLKILLKNDINLFAYHLPLDIHPLLGNNVMLAKLLNFEIKGQKMVDGLPLIFYGQLKQSISALDLSMLIAEKLQRQPLLIEANKPIKNIAWCTGAAQSLIHQVSHLGVDAYLSGEISESTVHVARELGLHYFAAGHHATERYGIKALGEHLAEKFQLSHEFVDVDSPV